MKKQSTLALAIGAAFAAAGGTVHAVTPPFSGSMTEFFISGASALDESLRAAVARQCVPGTMDEYIQGSNDRTFVCVPEAAVGLSTTQMAIHKSSAGGSGLGVTPLANNTAVPQMPLSSITLAACPTAVTVGASIVGGTTLVPQYMRRTCSGIALTPAFSDAGISDMEPKMFIDGTIPLTPQTPNALVFGIAVTQAAYTELQRIQGVPASIYTVSATVATPASLTAITGLTAIRVRDQEEYMPSLSKEVIGGLMAGAHGWDVIVGPAGDVMTPPAAQPEVYVARRFPSSGSQKSTELFLYGGVNPTAPGGTGLVEHSPKCNPSALQMQSGMTVSSAAAETVACGFGSAVVPSIFVAEGSGTGNVRNCLNLHNANGRFGIGLISLESPYSPTNGWRFIKIDGEAPSLKNAWNTRYKNVVEVSYQNSPLLADADKVALSTALVGPTGIGATDVQRALNSTFRHPFGDGGTLALVLNGATPLTIGATAKTQAEIQAQPVWHYSKSAIGGTDNCKPAVVVAPMQQ